MLTGQTSTGILRGVLSFLLLPRLPGSLTRLLGLYFRSFSIQPYHIHGTFPCQLHATAGEKMPSFKGR